MNTLGKPKQHVPVFVSSTYEDMKEYREAVREALHRLETIVRGMEYFGSRPRSPKEECLTEVRNCKAYVGVFAMRYGSIDDETGKSMTHLEYEEAQKQDLPTLIYLIDEENQPVLPKFVDQGSSAQKLTELKEVLKSRFTVSFFTTPDDLARRVTQDLPPILKHIGVPLDETPRDIVHAEARELIKKFNVRPRRYAGHELTIDCTIAGEVKSLNEGECAALKLPYGDAIKRQIKCELLGDKESIIAVKEQGDFLEALEVGRNITARIKFASGTVSGYDPELQEHSTILYKGYIVTDISLGDSPEPDTQDPGQQEST